MSFVLKVLGLVLIVTLAIAIPFVFVETVRGLYRFLRWQDVHAYELGEHIDLASWMLRRHRGNLPRLRNALKRVELFEGEWRQAAARPAYLLLNEHENNLDCVRDHLDEANLGRKQYEYDGIQRFVRNQISQRRFERVLAKIESRIDRLTLELDKADHDLQEIEDRLDLASLPDTTHIHRSTNEPRRFIDSGQ